MRDGVVVTEDEAPLNYETRFEYKYDQHGNWTERVVSGRIDSESVFRRSNVERRVITYY